MNTRSSFLMLVLLVFAVTFGLTACSCNKTGSMETAGTYSGATYSTATTETGETSGAMAATTGTAVSCAMTGPTTIDTISDCKNGTASLTHADGTKDTYQVSGDMNSLNQIREGDKVMVTPDTEMITSLRENVEPVENAQTSSAWRTSTGTKGGAYLTRSFELTGKVSAVDPANHTVTITGRDGSPRIYCVAPDISLTCVKVGQTLVMRDTQMYSIKPQTLGNCLQQGTQSAS